MKNHRTPPCPSGLTAEAKRLWRDFHHEYDLTDRHALTVLATALEAFDRMRSAQSAIAADGLVTRDRFGQAKTHPAATVERDARAQWLAALKSLGLDLEPDRPGPGPGRPPKALPRARGV